MRVGYVLRLGMSKSPIGRLINRNAAILASERETAKSLGLDGLHGPAIWALDIGLENDKSATHVLLVKLTIREDSKNRRNPWRLESARVVPDQLLKQTYGYDIEPQSDIVRILFVDQELSRHFSLHWEIKVNSETEGRLRKMIWSDVECDWLDWIANLVQYGSNRPDRPPEIDSYLFLRGSTREEILRNFLCVHMWADARSGTSFWSLLTARWSCMLIRNAWRTIVSLCSSLFLRTRAQIETMFKSVIAEAMSIADIKRELYCLEAVREFLLVADDLPFPFKVASVPVIDQARINKRDSTLLSHPYDQDWLGTLRSKVSEAQK
ncbi:hypothetical protein Moror_16043 [Moniliophthora roreri MCA 2997]|uniref:Uncharacterized protein n=1 Tax=Moniliophthora roreri (strain MCA 2997) TaxID=1381753 RepID=V2XIK5_MONRO|nr:hypothetical protein Moror_16043 [Moniliophthora roreri MCA 2997]